MMTVSSSRTPGLHGGVDHRLGGAVLHRAGGVGPTPPSDERGGRSWALVVGPSTNGVCPISSVMFLWTVMAGPFG